MPDVRSPSESIVVASSVWPSNSITAADSPFIRPVTSGCPERHRSALANRAGRGPASRGPSDHRCFASSVASPRGSFARRFSSTPCFTRPAISLPTSAAFRRALLCQPHRFSPAVPRHGRRRRHGPDPSGPIVPHHLPAAWLPWRVDRFGRVSTLLGRGFRSYRVPGAGALPSIPSTTSGGLTPACSGLASLAADAGG
jgi:hypothetical protein